MEVMTEKLELHLDKSTWTPVKFGDVVKEPKENCKDPLAEGVEHVVGLEHITSGDIHLRNSAGIEESTTFTKKFAKGDVLFGRRRAYLKKAAQANFDGICSGDITVFRAKPNLLPELLPFIVNNEKFFDYAVKHSAGGLSPRVKFKDLANYEFLLPPKAEQARIAKLLWAMDEVIEREKEVLERLTLTQQVKNKTLFNGLKDQFEYKKFGTLCDIERGGSPRPIDDYITDDEDGLNWIKIGDVDIESKFITRTKQKIKPSGLKKTRSVKSGDLILSNSMSFGRPYILKIDGCIHDGWLVIRDKKNVFDKEFLYYYLSSDEVYAQFEKFAAGGVVSNLNKEIVKTLKICLPPMNIQIQIKDELSFLDESNKRLMTKILSSQTLQKSLINQVF